MSYILDALRKSEKERRHVDTPVMSQPATEAVELPRRDMLPWIGVAFFLIATIAALTYWMLVLRQDGPSSAKGESATRVLVASAGSGAAGVPAIRPAPELKSHPLVSAPENAASRSLEDEAQVESSRSKPLVPERRPAPIGVVAGTPEPDGPVKLLRAMSSEFQRSLPPLNVSIHIYAPRESDRILYINNRQYHAGDRVRDDVRVEEIVEDGAVLSFRGQKFKLPRPS